MSWTAAHSLAWAFILPLVWSTIRDRTSAIEAKHGFVAEAPRVLFYADRAFPIFDLEVAFPIPSTGRGTWDVSNVIEAWYKALNYADKHQGNYPLTTCLHARFTKTSQSLLSAAYSTSQDDRVCWMEILSAYPKNEPNPNNRAAAMQPHLAMIQEVIPDWIQARNGRPHWAKNWQYVRPEVKMHDLFPGGNLQHFNDVRRRLDPNGIFVNPFLKQLNMFS